MLALFYNSFCYRNCPNTSHSSHFDVMECRKLKIEEVAMYAYLRYLWI
jgi:hypothetical protein